MLLQLVTLYFWLRMTLASPEEAKGPYQTLQGPKEAIFVETFDSDPLDRRWVLSKAVKEGEEDVLKYDDSRKRIVLATILPIFDNGDVLYMHASNSILRPLDAIYHSALRFITGEWALEESSAKSDKYGNRGLVLKSPGRHHAISAYLRVPYYLRDKLFILQYEVSFLRTIDCGGAYIKLLSHSSQLRLSHFSNATPYSIMFGPDKCGGSYKVHLIVCNRNPVTGQLREMHIRQPDTDLKEYFSDQQPHLYTLYLYPDHRYEILIDQALISKGSLLEDVDFGRPGENSDSDMKKPEDWDDRPLIPDPNATKPPSWDENAPALIPDPSAQRPLGWLVEEPPLIHDPRAKKPDDWDEDMDGTWESPQISNPKCTKAIGCGPWSPPLISNPSYKGKWTPPLIKNPFYQGPWRPGTNSNPAFAHAPPTLEMSAVAAVGLELWSLTGGVLFDNILLCDDTEVARRWTEASWGQRETPGLIVQLLVAAHKRPWLWGVYVFSVGLPAILFISFMWPDKRFGPPDMDYYYMKSDEPQEEDTGDSVGSTNPITHVAGEVTGPRRRKYEKAQKKSDLELKVGVE